MPETGKGEVSFCLPPAHRAGSRAYKKVLGIYDTSRGDVPDDVTLVWPEDNHGYIRRLSNPLEQLRSGGVGVYYHLSYWGAPRGLSLAVFDASGLVLGENDQGLRQKLRAGMDYQRRRHQAGRARHGVLPAPGLERRP